jgi:4-oxalmesaconate hydratase
VDALPITELQRAAIFEGNARRVFPRLDARLKARGL